LCFTAEGAAVPERFQIGFLDRILSLGVVFENRPRDAEQAAVVAPHEGFERPDLMGRSPRQQGRVVGPPIYD